MSANQKPLFAMEKLDKYAFHNRLKRFMLEKGMTVAELADATDRNEQTIYNLLNGNKPANGFLDFAISIHEEHKNKLLGLIDGSQTEEEKQILKKVYNLLVFKS